MIDLLSVLFANETDLTTHASLVLELKCFHGLVLLLSILLIIAILVLLRITF